MARPRSGPGEDGMPGWHRPRAHVLRRRLDSRHRVAGFRQDRLQRLPPAGVHAARNAVRSGPRPTRKRLSILNRNGWHEFLVRLGQNPEVMAVQNLGLASARPARPFPSHDPHLRQLRGERNVRVAAPRLRCPIFERADGDAPTDRIRRSRPSGVGGASIQCA